MSGPYRVEIADPGCTECLHGLTWDIIGPDEVAHSTSYGDQEEAESIARGFDRAYTLGQASPANDEDGWVQFTADQLPKEGGRVLVWDAEFDSVTILYYSAESDTLEKLQERHYTHWRLAPRGPRKPEPEVVAPAPVTDYTDDIPF